MAPWDRDVLMLGTLHALNTVYRSPYSGKLNYPALEGTPKKQRKQIAKLAKNLKARSDLKRNKNIAKKDAKLKTKQTNYNKAQQRVADAEANVKAENAAKTRNRIKTKQSWYKKLADKFKNGKGGVGDKVGSKFQAMADVADDEAKAMKAAAGGRKGTTISKKLAEAGQKIQEFKAARAAKAVDKAEKASKIAKAQGLLGKAGTWFNETASGLSKAGAGTGKLGIALNSGRRGLGWGMKSAKFMGKVGMKAAKPLAALAGAGMGMWGVAQGTKFKDGETMIKNKKAKYALAAMDGVVDAFVGGTYDMAMDGAGWLAKKLGNDQLAKDMENTKGFYSNLAEKASSKDTGAWMANHVFGKDADGRYASEKMRDAQLAMGEAVDESAKVTLAVTKKFTTVTAEDTTDEKLKKTIAYNKSKGVGGDVSEADIATMDDSEKELLSMMSKKKGLADMRRLTNTFMEGYVAENDNWHNNAYNDTEYLKMKSEWKYQVEQEKKMDREFNAKNAKRKKELIAKVVAKYGVSEKQAEEFLYTGKDSIWRMKPPGDRAIILARYDKIKKSDKTERIIFKNGEYQKEDTQTAIQPKASGRGTSPELASNVRQNNLKGSPSVRPNILNGQQSTPQVAVVSAPSNTSVDNSQQVTHNNAPTIIQHAPPSSLDV